MGFAQEFKEFAVKGNVMDLAVGVIVGGAFGKIVDSAIGDLIMPLIGRALGRVDFADLFIPLGEVPAGTASTLAAVKAAGVPVFAYGSFLTVVANFAILAWIVFLMVKAMNKLRRQAPAEPPAPAEDVVLLREIRDNLKARG